MSIPEDEKFKRYLRGFRPVAPQPLRVRKHSLATPRTLVLAGGAAACLAVLALVLLFVSHRHQTTQGSTNPLWSANPRLLTIGSANALLARAPSFKEAVDEVSIQPQTTPQSEGKLSALTVLSEENIKL